MGDKNAKNLIEGIWGAITDMLKIWPCHKKVIKKRNHGNTVQKKSRQDRFTTVLGFSTFLPRDYIKLYRTCNFHVNTICYCTSYC